MDITERIRYLCGLKGISVTKLETELDFGNGSLTKHKGIKSDRLLKLARYFNVTMEYLLTGEDPQGTSLVLYQQDPEFMGYIQRLWNLPKEYRKAIYKQIGYAERDYQEDLENKRKKEKDLA